MQTYAKTLQYRYAVATIVPFHRTEWNGAGCRAQWWFASDRPQPQWIAVSHWECNAELVFAEQTSDLPRLNTISQMTLKLISFERSNSEQMPEEVGGTFWTIRPSLSACGIFYATLKFITLLGALFGLWGLELVGIDLLSPVKAIVLSK